MVKVPETQEEKIVEETKPEETPVGETFKPYTAWKSEISELYAFHKKFSLAFTKDKNLLRKILFKFENVFMSLGSPSELFSLELDKAKHIRGIVDKMLYKYERLCFSTRESIVLCYSKLEKESGDLQDLEKRLNDTRALKEELVNKYSKPDEKEKFKLQKEMESLENELKRLSTEYDTLYSKIYLDVRNIKNLKILEDLYFKNYLVYKELYMRILEVEKILEDSIGPVVALYQTCPSEEVYQNMVYVGKKISELLELSTIPYAEIQRKFNYNKKEDVSKLLEHIYNKME